MRYSEPGGVAANSLMTGIYDSWEFNAGGASATSQILSYTGSNLGTPSGTVTGPAGGGDLARSYVAANSAFHSSGAADYQTISSAAIGFAFEFYIAINSSGDTTPAIEFMLNRNNTTGDRYCWVDWISKAVFGPSFDAFRVRANDDVGGSAIISTGADTVAPNDVWHHLLFWRDPADDMLRLQLDGGAVLSTSLVSTKTGSYGIRLCAATAECNINRFRVWSRPFTVAERIYLNAAVRDYPFV